MKTIQYILSIAIGLLCLILLEGMFTLGDAFNFENYNWFGYFIQSLLVIATICVSILCAKDTIDN